MAAQEAITLVIRRISKHNQFGEGKLISNLVFMPRISDITGISVDVTSLQEPLDSWLESYLQYQTAQADVTFLENNRLSRYGAALLPADEVMADPMLRPKPEAIQGDYGDLHHTIPHINTKYAQLNQSTSELSQSDKEYMKTVERLTHILAEIATRAQRSVAPLKTKR